ncbi:MAG: TolC family protein [Ferruginibacter sp.]
MKNKTTVNTFFAFLMILIMSFWIGDASGQASNNFSIKQSVEFALQNSISVKNALIDLQIQKQTNREIASAALPQVNGSLSGNYFPNVAVQSFPNFISRATYGVLLQESVKDGNGNTIVAPNDFGFVQAQFGTKYTANAGLDFSQLLFDGQVFVGLQALSASIDFQRKKIAVTEELIKVNIYKIYYQLVVAKVQLTSLDANIERFEKLLSDTKEIYKQGFAEKLDIDKVSVQLNNLKTEKVKLESQINAGNTGLKFLMNMPQKDTLVLTDTLNEDILKSDIPDNNYNYSDRKEFQLLEVGKKLGEYNIKRFKSSYLPTVALYGSYNKNAQRNQFNFFNNGQWFTSSQIGLKISIPIFDGFAKSARVSKAKLELEQTNNNIEQLKANIDNDIAQATLSFTTSLITINNQSKNKELAEKVYNTTKIKYEQGLGNNQEIYNAQAELKIAQNNYYSALYDAIIAKIDYQQATGKL